MTQAPLHPSEQHRKRNWWFWLTIAGLLLVLAGGVAGLVVWSQSLVFDYKVNQQERKLLLNATQMIEQLGARENEELIVGVGPEDYYKQRLADGTMIIGYSYNHDDPDLKFTLLHEIRTFTDQEKAAAEYMRVSAESARAIGPNTEDDRQADIFHAWEKATETTPASAVLIERSGNKVMVMQLSGDYSNDETVLLFLARPFREALIESTASED